MPASTLQAMAQRACIRNISSITDVADLPYDVVKPILRKVQNPAQLIEIEQNCPQIADADAELWRAFIARDIPDWKEKIIEPKNPRSWHKVHRKLLKEEQRRKEEQEEQLRAAMSGLIKEREENKATFIEKIVPAGKARERAFVDGVPNPKANAWGAVHTPALKNAKRGKDVVAALRAKSARAAKDVRATYGKDKTFTTTKALPSARQQISHAPGWMVRDLKKPEVKPAPAPVVHRPGSTIAAKKPGSVFAPSKTSSASERALNNAIAEREARLRALTQPKGRQGAARSPPPAQAARPITTAASPPPAARVQPPPRQASPVSSELTANRPAGIGSPARINSPVPQTRKRPAASVFMPSKKRKA